MAVARIYDAEFIPGTAQNHQSHLGKFWWVDTTSKTGTWTRQQAYDYVLANPGDIYVAEGSNRVTVLAYRNNAGTEWIQTAPDGTRRDNLMTLAQRHAQGLPNN